MTAPKRAFPGTHRVHAPAETLERIRPLFPRLGITRLADVTGLDRIGIPVYLCCRPNSRSLSVSQGKGLDGESACVSAAMESLELHHAERPLVPLRLASRNELEEGGEKIVAVESLPAPTTSRYRPDRPLLWTKATKLGREHEAAHVWLPFEVVHTSALLPAPSGSGCFLSTSNGLASGNSHAEALVHALAEVIERDSAAVWAARPPSVRETTRLDLATVEDAVVLSLLELYERADVHVSAWDVTSDIGIPTFLVEITDESGDGTSGFTGMGAHLSSAIALSRALTEAAQSRLTYVTGSRDDLFRRDYRKVLRASRPRDDGARTTTAPGRSFRAVESLDDAAFFEEDLEILTSRLARSGIEDVYVVDLTDERIGVPVVRVVVPGLEGPDDDPTYRPGARARRAAEDVS